MAATAGAIKAGRAYVEAFLDSSKLDKGLQDIRGNLNGFAKQVAAIGGGFLAMGTAIIGPMAAAVKQFADVGSQLDDMAQRTGVSAGALSELSFAAEMSGTSLESLENGLRKMQKSIVDAGSGLSTPIKALERIGVSVEDLQGLSTEEQFLKLAQGVSEIQDPTLRAATAMDLFGKSGTALLPMIAGGVAGIEEMREEARRLGITLSDEDAAAAAEMGDTLDTLTRSLQSVSLALGRELVPLALSLAQRLTEIIPEVRQWVEENGQLINLLAQIGGLLVTVGGGLLAVAAASKAASVAIGGVVIAKNLLLANLYALPIALAGVGIALFIREMTDAAGAAERLNQELDHQRNLLDDLANRRTERQRAILDEIDSIEDEQERSKYILDSMKMAGRAAQVATDDIERLEGDLRRLNDLGPAQGLRESLGMDQDVKAARERARLELAAARQRLKDSERFEKDLAGAFDAPSAKARETAAANEDVEKSLEKMREELETFGMSSAERALRALEELNASEEQLSEARRVQSELAAKEAAERQKAAEQQKQDSIADVFQRLQDEIEDLTFDPLTRDMEKQLRELRRLGASDEQLEEARRLLEKKSALGQTSDDSDPQRQSFSAPGGTFSSLSSQMFTTGGPEDRIANATEETARNTRRLRTGGGLALAE